MIDQLLFLAILIFSVRIGEIFAMTKISFWKFCLMLLLIKFVAVSYVN
tara:strand:- start:639 stop:782 length:144 start_codon:yes stop_codon:yes gene_type:complete